MTNRKVAISTWRRFGVAVIVMASVAASLLPFRASGDEVKSALLAIPNAAERAASEKLVHEIFAADFAKRTPAGQISLAQKLLLEAAKNGNDPTSQYVLLNDARELATSAGDAEIAFQAFDKLTATYKIDRDAILGIMLADLTKAPLTVAGANQAITAATAMVDRQCDAGDYASAAKTASQAEMFAQKTHNGKLLAGARARTADVLAEAHENDRAKAALGTLKTAPDDGDANLIVGSFLCFNRNDWSRGLPYLAKSSDPVLKKAAVAERDALDRVTGAQAVGDGWWDAAGGKTGIARQAMRGHAADWYRQALPTLAGLTAELARKRIAETGDSPGASIPMPIDLLALVDPKRDAVNGSWSMERGVLKANGGTLVRLQVQYHPTAEYDLKIVYSYTTGSEEMMLMLPTAQGMFMIVNNSDSAYSEVGNGIFDRMNHPMIKRGDPCTLIMHVRKDRVQGYVNGQLFADFKPADHAMGIKDGWRVRDDTCIGLGNWNTTVLFAKIELMELKLRQTKLEGANTSVNQLHLTDSEKDVIRAKSMMQNG